MYGFIDILDGFMDGLMDVLLDGWIYQLIGGFIDEYVVLLKIGYIYW